MTKRLALFDIDGVLADDRHRVHYALKQDWMSYFKLANVAADDVWEQGKSAVYKELLDFTTDVGYLTGRREDLRPTTQRWLNENGFPAGPAPHMLIMRQFSQRERLAELKAATIAGILKDTDYDQVVLYDDDPEVIRVVQEQFGTDAGIHCTWHIKEEALIKKATA